MKLKKFNILFIVLFFWLFLPLVHAAEPQVQAVLDRQQANIDEELHLSVKVTGVRGSVQTPKLPPLEAFEIFYSGRSSQFSFINGKSESLTEFNYVLIPRAAGQYVIQPIKVTIEGKEYMTNQVRVSVLDGGSSAGTSQQRPSLPPYPQSPAAGPAGSSSYPSGEPAVASKIDDQIFLEVKPSKRTVYANEQLILNYSLYTMLDTRYEGFIEEPETSGFWIEEFPMGQDIEKTSETVRGRRYVRADIRKIALFPTAPGKYTIKPGVIKTSVQLEQTNSSLFDEFFSDSFFSGSGLFARRVEKRLTAAPIEIEVKPLPEANQPEHFKGAVGQFRMSTAVDRRSLKQNEALTLTVTIEGEGNIETISAPQIPELPGVKVYESDTKTQLFRMKDVIAGKKVFEIIMIPGQAGEFKIPSLQFSFFDPRQAQYVTLNSDPYQIVVQASNIAPPALPKEIKDLQAGEPKKQIELESEGIYYIKESLSQPLLDPKLVLLGLAGVDTVLTFAFFGIVMTRRRSDYLEQNVALKRNLFARKFVRQKLAYLSKLESRAGGGEPVEHFYIEYAKVLNQYLADKLNLSVHGLTQNAVMAALENRGVSRELMDEIRYCFDVCDQVRFARIAPLNENPQTMMQRLKVMISHLERL